MNLLSHFDKFNTQLPVVGAQQSAREQAVAFLREKGLPTRKNEDWKYTSVKILNDENFLPSALEQRAISPETLQNLKSKLNPAFINIVFHNGVWQKTLSSALPKGVHFEVLPTVGATAFVDSFEALSAVYSTQAFCLRVDADIAVPATLNFVFYTSLEGGPALMVHPRMQVQVGARSSVKVLESYYGQNEARYFVNSQTDAQVGDSAKLVLVRLQDDSRRAVNVGRSQYHLGRAATLHSLSYSTGALLARHDLNLRLTSPEASAFVDGLYVVRGSQHVDNATVMDHQVGACNTFQHYKGILADQSRAVFNGKVVIRPGAQKANSEQLNNNLLLSREAEADSKPQLEIYADDVKAAHGSTVGQLNREELFYLESRAISREQAVAMLSLGYVSELIYKIEDLDLQNWLNKELQGAFADLQLTEGS